MQGTDKFPEGLCAFFQSRHMHYVVIPKNSQTREVTYKNIEGSESKDTLERYRNDSVLLVATEEVPFTTGGESDDTSNAVIKKALEILFGKSDAYSDFQRLYMLRGTTLPIKVKFKINGRKRRQAIYIKKPSAQRVVGKYLYQIISGIEQSCYAFNERVLIEESVKGAPLSKLDERLYIRDRKYQEGLVRAAVHAEVLGLGAEASEQLNRIVDPDRRTVFFDFDLIFQEKSTLNLNNFLTPYMAPRQLPACAVDWLIDEQIKVAARLVENYKQIMKLASIAGSIMDLTRKSIDDRMLTYGSKSLCHHFDEFIDAAQGL